VTVGPLLTACAPLDQRHAPQNTPLGQCPPGGSCPLDGRPQRPRAAHQPAL